MKKFLLVILGLLILNNFAHTQVVEDFEKPGNLGIFKDAQWGTLTDSIYQTTDPTGKSQGVMAVAFDLKASNAHNAIQLNGPRTNFPTNGAQVLSYSVYIPADSKIPDSLVFGVWVQPANWSWNEVYIYAKDIPKGVWYPLNYYLLDSSIANPSDDNYTTIMDCGIQWNNNKVDSTQAFAIWKGVIYIDNVSFLGTKPFEYAAFDADVNNFIETWNNGWIDTVKWNPGPIGNKSGILEFDFKSTPDSSKGTAVGIQPTGGFAASDYNMIVFWVYVDNTFPDNGWIQTWGQDNNTWSWPTPKGPITYAGKDIPKNVWFPMYFDMTQATAADGTTFNHIKYPLGKFGLQFGGANWFGSIYIDKVEFINAKTGSTGPEGPSWVITNFDNTASGVQGFTVASWDSSAVTGISRVTNPNPRSTGDGALKAAVDFSKGNKGLISKKNVPLYNEANSTMVHTITLDVMPSSNFASGSDFEFVIMGPGVSSGWEQVVFSPTNAQWNTVTLNLKSLIDEGKVDPSQPAEIGIQVHNASNNTYKGSFWLDNLTTYGTGQISDVNDIAGLPKVYHLYNNYPNPFNPVTAIKYELPKQSFVSLKVYDIMGREVATLVSSDQKAGYYEVNFDASKLASGVYVYRITAGEFIHSQKMMLLK